MSAAGHADTGGTANSTNDDNTQDDPLYACRGQTNKRHPSTDDGLQELERRDITNVLNHRLHHPGCLTGARGEEEEEEARNLVSSAMAIKREKDAE